MNKEYLDTAIKILWRSFSPDVKNIATFTTFNNKSQSDERLYVATNLDPIPPTHELICTVDEFFIELTTRFVEEHPDLTRTMFHYYMKHKPEYALSAYINYNETAVLPNITALTMCQSLDGQLYSSHKLLTKELVNNRKYKLSWVKAWDRIKGPTLKILYTDCYYDPKTFKQVMETPNDNV